MGVTKTNLFSDTQNELAAFAKVLGHPARIAIIQYLLKTDTCCNHHLVDDLGLAQATISQHLKEMKQLGIIQGTVEGVSVNYCINPEKWLELKARFSELFDGYRPGDCLSC
jgi:predicted transcriptional regulator